MWFYISSAWEYWVLPRCWYVCCKILPYRKASRSANNLQLILGAFPWQKIPSTFSCTSREISSQVLYDHSVTNGSRGGHEWQKCCLSILAVVGIASGFIESLSVGCICWDIFFHSHGLPPLFWGIAEANRAISCSSAKVYLNSILVCGRGDSVFRITCCKSTQKHQMTDCFVGLTCREERQVLIIWTGD